MCLFPTRASQQTISPSTKQLLEGAHSLTRIKFATPKPDPDGDLLLPCGKCVECLTKRSSEWAIRCKHEISLHEQNCFLTLTYDEKNLPPLFTYVNGERKLTCKLEFTKFLKRLRKHTKTNLRYIVSHEFGTENQRVHHHAIIFGWNPSNQKLLSNNSGNPLFRSVELEKLWKFGYSSIGTANEKTAYYIASYALKGKTHSVTDPQTGEIVTLKDSMNVSTKPGIGLNFLTANMQTLALTNNFLPRYYRKKLEQLNSNLLSQHENILCQNMKSTSGYEKLSRFIIKKQKNNSTSYLRSAPETKKLDQLYESHLRDNII